METEDCAPEECPPTTTVTYAPIEVDVPFWVVLYVYMIIFWPCTLICFCMCCVLAICLVKNNGNKPPPRHPDQMMGEETDPYAAAF
jgi:hypothetical protein